MATSYSREDIVDLAMQMLGGGASLDDVIAAAANYGVDLASVYYSDPGTTVTVDVPADTGPVDTGPIYSEPDDSGFEDVIVDPRSGSSGRSPVQSPLSTVSSSPVSTVVTPGALPTGGDTSISVLSPLASEASSGTPALDINTEVKDVKDYFKVMTGAAPTMSDAEIASYIKNNPETYNLDLLWLTEQNNPSLTPVSTPDTVIGALGNDTVVGGLGAIPTDADTVADVTNDINRKPEQAAFTQTQVNEAVLTALQNGMTTAEIKEIAEELKVPTASIENAFVNLVGNQSDADIIKGVSELSKTGSITFENIVAYADENKLPYATVANALKSTFKDTTQEQILNSMVYEKDRQQFSALEQPKLDKDGELVLDANGNLVWTVNLGDAIAQSIKQSIAPENLAKFYGKSEAEFKELVNANLKQVATTLRDAGIDAQQGLTDLLGVDKSVTQTALRDVDISNKLQDLQKDELTYSEILSVADENNISITDFVNKYLGGESDQKAALTKALTAESKFTPKEQALRDAYRGLEAAPTMQQVLDYQSKQKLSDADMERIFGEFTKVTAKDLDNYRVSTALQGYSGEDKQLSYPELAQFAKDNNMDLSKVVSYVGTSESQPEILKNLQAYVKDEEFKQSLSGTELTDYQGKKYAASDLMKLAEQVKQNLDLKSSSGGVYKTEGQSVGFDYDEAKKLFPEGKGPTVIDQVALDIARGLLKAGVKDVSELSKYKPTEVTVPDYNVEGSPTEYKVTKLINPETGEEAPNLGATYTGEGGTVYSFSVDASGKPVFGTAFTDTSDKEQIATVIAFAAAILAPQILPELIGAAPSAVAGVEGALSQAALGGSGLTGSLMAAGLPATAAQYAATAIVNGVYNGAVAEATGGDFDKAFISGGIAPVLGQITANAVNSALADLQLPAGIDKAAGNAVMQLVAKGEIDPTQVITAGVSPTVSKAIQESTGLNAAQTKLVLDTVVTQGKNLEALMNPQTAVNFVMQNKGLFDNLGLDAASGVKNIQTGQAVDLGAFNEGEIKQLQSMPSTLGDAVISEAVVTGNGDPVFLGGETSTQPVVTDTSGTQTIPGGSITIIPGQPKLVTDEVSGETYVTSDDRAYVPVLEYYQGPNGTVYTRDLRTDTVTQYTPQGGATSVLGGELLLGGESENRGVIVSGLPPTAKFMQTVYTDDITAGSTPGASLPKSGDSYLLTQSLDQSVNRPAYLTTTDLPDGSKQVFNRLTGDRATINASGDVTQESLSKYSKLNNAFNAVLGTVQVGTAELGKFYSGAAQQIAIKMGLDDTGTQKLINFFQDIENSGRVMRPEFINQSANQFVQDVYRDMQAAADRSETGQPSGSEQFEILKNAIKNNPAGALTLFGEELVQNPELLLAGPGKLIGSFILNVGESAGAQALDKANELKQADIRAGKPVKTDREYASLASKDAGTAALVTGLVSMVPGLGGPATKVVKETGSEYLEEFTIAKMTGKSDAEAASNGAIGAFLGGKVAATSELGNAAQQYAAGRLGIQPAPEVVAGAANAPGGSVTVTGKLPSATIGGEPPQGIFTPDIVGTNVPASNVLTAPPEFSVAEPSLVLTPKLNDILVSAGDSSQQAVSMSDNQISVINGAIQKIKNGQITTPQQLNNALQQIVDEGNLNPSQLPTVIQAINKATNIGAVTQGQTGIGTVLPTGQQSGTGIVFQLPGTSTQPNVVVQPKVVANQQQDVVTQPETVTNQQQNQQQQNQQTITTQTNNVKKPVITPPVDVKPFIDVEPPKPATLVTSPEVTTTPVTPIVPPEEFVFKPVEQNIIDTILTPTPPVTPTTPTTPTTTTKPVTPPTITPSIPFIPFFPTSRSGETTYVDYGQPEVLPPELSGMFYIPPPEYTRATGPMANVGIMSGVTK